MTTDEHSLFHDVLRRHAGEVAVHLRARWPREPEVPDLAQEAFLRLWANREAGVIRDPYAFLLQTVDRLAIDQHRRRAIRERHAAPGVGLETIVDPKLA